MDKTVSPKVRRSHMSRFPNKILKRLLGSKLAQSIAILASGSLLAQAVTMLASPVLTRLYTPAEFGLFAAFMALVSTLMPAICGRFEFAVVVANSNAHAKQLLGLALQAAFFLSVTVGLALFFLDSIESNVIYTKNIGAWLYCVPIFLMLGAVVLAFSYQSNRLHHYGLIAKVNLVQAIIGVFTTIGFGLLDFKTNGLLIGNLMGLIAVNVWLLYFYRSMLSHQILLSASRKTYIFRKYHHFPIYDAPTALLNGVASALPVFFLTEFFSADIVGYYALLMRVAQAPLGFISTAVSQINLKKVSDLVHAEQPIRPYLLQITLVLMIIVVPASLILVLFSPDLFASVFGDQWRMAGVLTQIFAPALGLRFVVSTVSGVLDATGNNRLAAMWKTISFTVTLLMFSLSAYRLDIEELFVAMLITDVTLYLIYYLLIWYAAGNPRMLR